MGLEVQVRGTLQRQDERRREGQKLCKGEINSDSSSRGSSTERPRD